MHVDIILWDVWEFFRLNRVEKLTVFCITALIVVMSSLLIAQWLPTYISFSNEPSEEMTNSGSEWRLQVDGLVESPLNLTFDELTNMPRTTVNAELYCVNPPLRVISEGDWVGVRLGLILEQAGVSSETVKVAFYAKDDFSTDLPISTAMREDIILAYEKDGEPLREETRLVVPGKWGYKWIHHVIHIELVNYDFKGTYESSGYSDTAEILGDTTLP